MKLSAPILAFLLLPGLAMAQTHSGHDAMQHSQMSGGSAPVTEGGQAAFTAIHEIVEYLMADPETDWSKVDIEALRQHLIDMDNVTLRADVATRPVEGGARFSVTSDQARVTDSIRAMVMAHVAVMNGTQGWEMAAQETEDGAILTVTGPDPERILGLGFIGLMTVGAHHQAHHLALASGQNPHHN